MAKPIHKSLVPKLLSLGGVENDTISGRLRIFVYGPDDETLEIKQKMDGISLAYDVITDLSSWLTNTLPSLRSISAFVVTGNTTRKRMIEAYQKNGHRKMTIFSTGGMSAILNTRNREQIYWNKMSVLSFALDCKRMAIVGCQDEMKFNKVQNRLLTLNAFFIEDMQKESPDYVIIVPCDTEHHHPLEEVMKTTECLLDLSTKISQLQQQQPQPHKSACKIPTPLGTLFLEKLLVQDLLKAISSPDIPNLLDLIADKMEGLMFLIPYREDYTMELRKCIVSAGGKIIDEPRVGCVVLIDGRADSANHLRMDLLTAIRSVQEQVFVMDLEWIRTMYPAKTVAGKVRSERNEIGWKDFLFKGAVPTPPISQLSTLKGLRICISEAIPSKKDKEAAHTVVTRMNGILVDDLANADVFICPYFETWKLGKEEFSLKNAELGNLQKVTPACLKEMYKAEKPGWEFKWFHKQVTIFKSEMWSPPLRGMVFRSGSLCEDQNKCMKELVNLLGGTVEEINNTTLDNRIMISYGPCARWDNLFSQMKKSNKTVMVVSYEYLLDQAASNEKIDISKYVRHHISLTVERSSNLAPSNPQIRASSSKTISGPKGKTSVGNNSKTNPTKLIKKQRPSSSNSSVRKSGSMHIESRHSPAVETPKNHHLSRVSKKRGKQLDGKKLASSSTLTSDNSNAGAAAAAAAAAATAASSFGTSGHASDDVFKQIDTDVEMFEIEGRGEGSTQVAAALENVNLDSPFNPTATSFEHSPRRGLKRKVDTLSLLNNEYESEGTPPSFEQIDYSEKKRYSGKKSKRRESDPFDSGTTVLMAQIPSEGEADQHKETMVVTNKTGHDKISGVQVRVATESEMVSRIATTSQTGERVPTTLADISRLLSRKKTLVSGVSAASATAAPPIHPPPQIPQVQIIQTTSVMRAQEDGGFVGTRNGLPTWLSFKRRVLDRVSETLNKCGVLTDKVQFDFNCVQRGTTVASSSVRVIPSIDLKPYRGIMAIAPHPWNTITPECVLVGGYYMTSPEQAEIRAKAVEILYHIRELLVDKFGLGALMENVFNGIEGSLEDQTNKKKQFVVRLTTGPNQPSTTKLHHPPSSPYLRFWLNCSIFDIMPKRLIYLSVLSNFHAVVICDKGCICGDSKMQLLARVFGEDLKVVGFHSRENADTSYFSEELVPLLVILDDKELRSCTCSLHPSGIRGKCVLQRETFIEKLRVNDGFVLGRQVSTAAPPS